MKRPLGWVLVLYMSGLLMGELFQPPLVLLFATSLTLAALTIALSRFRLWLIPVTLILTGWTNVVWRTAVVSPHDLRLLLAEEAELATVRGVLRATPNERVYLRADKETLRTLAQLQVTGLRREGVGWQPAFGEVAVTMPGTLPKEYFAGQEVEITGILAPPPRPAVPGLFDYRTYLRRQGIYFQLKADGAEDWQLLPPKRARPWMDRFLTWGQAALGRGLPTEDQPLRLLWAMTLGWRSGLTNESYEPFIQSGTMHIFAISGLHIALIAGILMSLLRAFQVSRAWCGLVVIPLLWWYTAATGWQPSAVRSTVMMSVVIGGWSLKRPSDMLNSLAASGLIILLIDPQQLFQAGFQLSFFVVLSIALFLPPLERARDRLLEPDPMLPASLVPRWRRWLGRPLRYLLTSMATSTAAWLGSWPLTAYYFHLFSPVTLLANLVVVPLSSAALACNLGSLICDAWFPWATQLFNHSGWFWMWLMIKASETAAHLPGAFFYVRPPNLADFAIYYGALFAALSGIAFARKWRFPTVTAAICVMLFYAWRWQAEGSTVKVAILPLNGGSAIYCDAPGSGKDLLVDCGNASGVEFVTKPFLHGQGVNRVTCLAVTHGDLRQMGGVESLEQMMSVEQIVTSPARFRSPAYRRLIASLQEPPQRWLTRQRGDSLRGWRVLHPGPDDQFPHADDNALVLSASFRGSRILLLSDLGRPGQEALLAQAGDLRAEIVVAGLPEKGEPLCDALLEAIQPKLIVIADSEFPATRRAGTALRERLARCGATVLCTRNTGSVTIVFRPGRWTAETMNGGEVEVK